MLKDLERELGAVVREGVGELLPDVDVLLSGMGLCPLLREPFGESATESLPICSSKPSDCLLAIWAQ